MSVTQNRPVPPRSLEMEARTAEQPGFASHAAGMAGQAPPAAVRGGKVALIAAHPPVAVIGGEGSTASARARRAHRLDDVLSRALDVALSTVMLVLLMPLLALIALLVRLDSPGPVLFRQPRVGRDRESFTVNKFRTMHNGVGHDAHRAFVLGLIAGEQPERPNGGPRFKLVADERVTRLGGFLRRSSLDELPQLWNVLRGDMSLVGPRPPIDYEVAHYPAHWFARFAVKPGLTGLWQVSGRSDLTLEQMIALDVEYVERRSVWLNFSILARTIPVVLSGKGAS
jgi:lipopolysaccharide/colanic/teichoic acid biosynthesis glycosyltransferase